jgi:hypothetical protein
MMRGRSLWAQAEVMGDGDGLAEAIGRHLVAKEKAARRVRRALELAKDARKPRGSE